MEKILRNVQLLLNEPAKRSAVVFTSLVVLTALFALWQVDIPIEQQDISTEFAWALPELPQSTQAQEDSAMKLRQRNPWGPEDTLSEAELARKKRIEEAKKRQEEAKKQAELARKKREEEEEKKRQLQAQRQKEIEAQQHQIELERQKALEEQRRLAEQKRLAEERRQAEERKREQQKLLKQNFVGIIKQGEQTFVLLLGNNSTIRFALGSELPGYGVSLAGIHKDFIEVQRGDDIEVVSLYNDEHLKKDRPILETMLKKPELEEVSSEEEDTKEIKKDEESTEQKNEESTEQIQNTEEKATEQSPEKRNQ